MKFDVIIGNPPYQRVDGGGGSSATPVYHRFVERAMRLGPRYVSMIIPSRWYSGGKGLAGFRRGMLGDGRLRRLVDHGDSRDCFPGVDLAGGVCYFLWDRDKPGRCLVETRDGDRRTESVRDLGEHELFIRDGRTAEIVRRVAALTDRTLAGLVSRRNPFGVGSREKPREKGDLALYASSGDGRIDSGLVLSGFELVDQWKVLLSKSSSDHAGQPDRSGRRKIFSRVAVMPPGSVCSESYLVAGGFEEKRQAENLARYLATRFCRFLVSAVLLTQNITRGKFLFAPAQDFSQRWTDDKLLRKYGLAGRDAAFMEALIKPMRVEGAVDE
ncbi:MAG: Eco57I restriction-modification methylase domain-containing protein [Deltaproteobacteria bacterium]|jgi:site-specific DNA-methyltransferase (adenine-specific)|nr:Eco57I restriction-modification methylase domain-containing protein [Deltaproteobacteria bacterium]